MPKNRGQKLKLIYILDILKRYSDEENPLNATEIAEKLGFSSANYFTRVFKAKTNVTPTEYSKYVSKRRLAKDI